MPDLQSARPTRKVMSGGIAAAVVTILVVILEQGFNTNVSAELAAAMTTIVGFFVAYVVPGAPRDFVAVEHPPVPHGRRVPA